MVSPTGLGIWLWDMNQLGKSWPAIAHRCASMGLRWVCIRAGMFTATPEIIKNAFGAYEIAIFTWHYAVPDRDAKEIAVVKQCKDAGSLGHVLDPEMEYATDAQSHADAKRFVSALRQAVGSDYFVGYAPFCDPQVFPKYPYAEFSAECAAAMPQIYFTVAKRASIEMITWLDPQWTKLGLSYTMPILSVWGSNDPRNIDPKAGPFVLKELTDALAHFADKPAVSLWALESIHKTAEDYLKSKTGPVAVAPHPDFDLTTVTGQQSALQWLGYPVGDIDGIAGPQTKAAVILFQRDHGCAPDGVLGPQSAAALTNTLDASIG